MGKKGNRDRQKKCLYKNRKKKQGKQRAFEYYFQFYLPLEK